MALLKRGGRKMYKKRRAARRAARKPGMRSKFADTHSFKLQADNTVLTNVLSGGVGQPKANGDLFIGQTSVVNNRWNFTGSFAFNAAQTLQWTQLNTLFDRYKVNGIKVNVIPQNNVSNVNGGGVIPVMRIVHDYDDNQVPSMGDVWSRRGIERRLDKPFSLYFKPKMLGLVWRSSTTTASSPQTCKFIDCAQGDVPLFGLKFGVKDWYATSVPNDLNCRFEITYYITFRNQIQIGRAYDVLEETVSAPLEGQHEEDIACENKPPV